jgi:hypothetical protein
VIAVFDIDGVLADASHRQHLVEQQPRDWDSFFDAVDGDDLLEHGRALLLELAVDHEVVLLSGRPERTRPDTEAWLTGHGIPVARLVLRADADRRRAADFKADLVRSIGSPEDIAVIVDDDASVVDRLSGLGYRCRLFL